MKPKYFFLVLLPVLLVWISGCDHIADPNEKYAPTVVGTNFVTKTNASVSHFKKALLEDYTGQQCVNCPPAGVASETLSLKYEDTLVVLAVHAGGFAVPSGTLYTNDFRTPAGNTWDGTSGFRISLDGGNPNGMISRISYTPGATAHIKGWTTWNNYIPGIIHSAQDIKLDVTSNYDTVVRALNVDVKIKFKKAYAANDVRLSVVLSEDSLIGPQKSTPTYIPNYVFMHVMRGAINGDWGDIINTSAVAVNDSTSKSYSNFSVNSSFKDKRVSVIVFAYNATSKEVIQVEKVKIR